MVTELVAETGGTIGPRGVVLRTFQDFVAFGEFAAASQFAPSAMRGKPADCTLAIILGAEIGLTPMAALQGIAVVNGKPSAYGDALIAVCKASPLCEFIEESVEGEGDAMVAVCRAKRRGYDQPSEFTFSVADAKKAGLWTKEGPWKQYPKRMLQMRARGFCLRDVFPDVLRGIISREEAEDYPTDAAPVVTRQQQPLAPAKQTRRIAKAPTPTVVEPAAPVEPVPAADEKAAEDGPVAAVGILEKALAVIATAETPESLMDFRNRADTYLIEKKVTKEEHDSITAAIDERADYLRSVRQMGSPNAKA